MRRLGFIVFAACTSGVPDRPTYDTDIAPILMANCARCHGAPTMIAEGRNCLRADLWDSTPDTAALCPEDLPTTAPAGMRTDMIVGAHDGGAMIVASVLDHTMPKGGPPLTDRQIEILQRWMEAGFPKRANNAPPAITFVTPPAGGATVDQSYVVEYDVTDADGDPVTWSLTWKGTNGKSGTFATGLHEGHAKVTIDTSTLGSGSYTLTANLDDGSSKVSIDAPGMLTVPAGRNAAPTVLVMSPNGGESYYQTQTAMITWLGDDDGPSLTCDLVAISGGATVPIATSIPETSGQAGSYAWNLATVPPALDYQVLVTVHDSGSPSLSASDRSDASFVVSAPPQQVSFSGQLQPIFNASCTGAACHDATLPQQGLNLTAGSAYGALVNVTAQQCTAEKLVAPGLPDQSYLIAKLVGSGTCYTGSRMPKGAAALTAAQIQLFRDWIANGAPNN